MAPNSILTWILLILVRLQNYFHDTFKTFLILFPFPDCGRLKKKKINVEGSFLNSAGSSCTSVFISDRFVLTAGHCTNNL